MKKGLAAICVFTGLILSLPIQVRGDATVYWDSDAGFSPATAVIGPGETVTWWNYDPYGFDVTVTFNGSFSFDLPNYCLLYTSDAADDLLCVDLGGRRIIKKT